MGGKARNPEKRGRNPLRTFIQEAGHKEAILEGGAGGDTCKGMRAVRRGEERRGVLCKLWTNRTPSLKPGTHRSPTGADPVCPLRSPVVEVIGSLPEQGRAVSLPDRRLAPSLRTKKKCAHILRGLLREGFAGFASEQTLNPRNTLYRTSG